MLRAVNLDITIGKGKTTGKITVPRVYTDAEGVIFPVRGFIRTFILRLPAMTGSTATMKLYDSDNVELYDSLARTTGQNVVVHVNYDLAVFPGDQIRVESASSEGVARDVVVIMRVERR